MLPQSWGDVALFSRGARSLQSHMGPSGCRDLHHDRDSNRLLPIAGIARARIVEEADLEKISRNLRAEQRYLSVHDRLSINQCQPVTACHPVPWTGSQRG